MVRVRVRVRQDQADIPEGELTEETEREPERLGSG